MTRTDEGSELVDSLLALLPPGQVLTRSEDVEPYGSDWATRFGGSPAAVVFPKSVAEIVAVVNWARAARVPLVPSGGRTGLSGGAAAGAREVVLSLGRMRGVLEFDPVDRTVTVEAGITTQAIQDLAREKGLYYPVDFASRGSSQIGGNVATNAGGIRVIRHGLTRDWVVGLKVVTGEGKVLEVNRSLVKNATGYDLRHLFIGSEGTLGIVAEVTLQLTDPPQEQQVMLLAVSSLDDLMPVLEVARKHLTLSAFEFFSDRALNHVLAAGGRSPFRECVPYYALLEFDLVGTVALDLFEVLLEKGLVADGVLAQSHTEAAELWRLREGITESIAQYRPYKNDIAVRVADVPRFLRAVDEMFAAQYPQFEVIWFGHLGDGNLHLSVLPSSGIDQGVFDAACDLATGKLAGLLRDFGGTISAEHGIGLLKKPYLHFSRSQEEIDLMRQMKRVFDPAGILNPGKIFD